MDAFLTWLAQLDFDRIRMMAITLLSGALCITVHESCHGLAALALGDRTAKNMGRISLNPLKHVDPVGLLMMATVGFGWARAVPINMGNFKNPKRGMALSALAGPLSNILLAMLASTCYSVCAFYTHQSGSEVWYYFAMFFLNTTLLSVGLAVFNLLPIPPLDGSKVLFSLIPNRWYFLLMRYERYGKVLLILLLMGNVLDTPLEWMRSQVINMLNAVCLWPYDLLTAIYH